jgi:methylmalonyl-CoA mutase
LLAPFDPATREMWEARVDADLKRPGAANRLTHEVSGVSMDALSDPDTMRALPVPDRTGRWRVRPAIWGRDIAHANATLRDEIERGVDGFRVRVAGPSRPVLDGAGPDAPRSPKVGRGLALTSTEDMAALLEGIALDAIALDWDADVDSAAVLGCWLRVAGGGAIRGTVGLDPIGTLLTTGRVAAHVPRLRSEMGAIGVWAAERAPAVRVARASAAPFHDAGCSITDEIAFTLAAAVEYVRWMIDGGLAPREAFANVDVATPVSADVFAQAAKLRAMRALLVRVAEAFGVVEADVPIHASTSWRMVTQREAELNLLRHTSAAMAAAVGGATTLTPLPHDVAILDPEDTAVADSRGSTARHLAANLHTILDEEAHVARVDDPARGSWYLETLSHDFARAAWARFQDVERCGGLAAAVIDGTIGGWVREAHAERQRAIAERRVSIVGVSQYARVAADEAPPEPVDPPDLDEPGAFSFTDSERARLTAVHDAVEPPGAAFVDRLIEAALPIFAVTGAVYRGEEPLGVQPLPGNRDAVAFEDLRRMADAAQPRIAVVPLGPPKRHKLRLDFTRRLFTAGGVHVDVEDAAPPNAPAVAFVGADEDLGEIAARAETAKKAGAARVYVAVPPTHPECDRWSHAGVDVFVHRTVNVVDVVADLFDALGIGNNA